MVDINKFLEQAQEFDFNEIDWDRIGVWPFPAKMFVCLLACFVILFGCHFLVVKDKNRLLKSAQNQEVQLKKEFETKAYEAANLDRYRLQMQEMSGTLNALVSRLPSSIEVPGLLDDIDDKAIESRLNIDSVDPQQEVTTEFHIELPIQIDVTGGYHEFGAFVSGIAGMPRIVTLHDFTVTQKSEDTGLLSMAIIAKTYRYKGEDE